MKTQQRQIKATANHSQRTFTLRIAYADGSTVKYRTIKMSRDDFQSSLNNTTNDWNQFLKTNEYYKL